MRNRKSIIGEKMLPTLVGYVVFEANEIIIEKDAFRSSDVVFNMSIKASKIIVKSLAFQDTVIGTTLSNSQRPALLIENVELIEDFAFFDAKIDSIVFGLKSDRNSFAAPISQNAFGGIKSGLRTFEYVHFKCEKRSYSLYFYSPPSLCPISEASKGKVKLKFEDCERFPFEINCNFSQILIYSNLDADSSTSYHIANGLFWTNQTIDRFFIRKNPSVFNFSTCVASQSILHRVFVESGKLCTGALIEQQKTLLKVVIAESIILQMI